MAILTDVVAGVRQKMRDFPRAFSTDISGDGVTQILELPVLMVEPTTLSVVQVDEANDELTTLVSGSDFTLDAHHGDLVLVNQPLAKGQAINVFGQNYRWFLDTDIIAEASWWIRSLDDSIDDDFFFATLELNDPRFELTLRGTLVGCLWALLIELSFDIDTNTAEGVSLPVSQRFAQVEKLVEVWTDRYTDLAEALNLGVDRIQMLTLRRTSKTTGRLVPIYEAMEFDDHATPQRIGPLIDEDQLLSNPVFPRVVDN